MTTFKVRDFEKLPSVLREYGAAFLLLTQSGAKLEKLYSKLDRSSIEANFGNIFLGCTQDVEALKYYPLFFGKYEKEKKCNGSGSSGGGRNSSVTISTQKEEIYESKSLRASAPFNSAAPRRPPCPISGHRCRQWGNMPHSPAAAIPDRFSETGA